MAEIPAETSKRICVHMNDDHGVTIHGMVAALDKSKGMIKNAKMTKISLTECTLSYSICKGDVCEMKTAFYPFEPPLKSATESRRRLVEIHSKVLSPNFFWLLSDPLAFAVLLMMTSLGVATYIGKQEVGIYLQEDFQGLSRTLTKVFGSTHTFVFVGIGSFWFAVVVHLVEAVYCTFLGLSKLKLNLTIASQWFVLISLVGLPITRRFMVFFRIHQEVVSKKKN